MELQKNSVLIVDDESLNITALSDILNSEYTVYAEKTGQGCINSAKELKPDLILLDIVMPGMNGYDVIKILKSDEETCDIPVIFVTGLNNAKDEERSFDLGAADYISKPYSVPVVKLRVKNQIRMVNHVRRINKLGTADILTGISNRRHFNAMLLQEWKKAGQEKKHIGFMVIDINNFEAYNATHGHLRGDLVLREIAQLLENHFQHTSCQACRWGGEEFAAILPGKNINEVRSEAEGVRDLICDHKFAGEDEKLNVSISIGVNSFIPTEDVACDLDNFISDTTEAIAHAKNNKGISAVCDIN